MTDPENPIALTEQEVLTLADCESAIRKGLETFIEVGRALATIKDRRLYREKYPTFDAYCRERWGWSKIHGYRMIRAAAVGEKLEPKPLAMRQAFELAKVPEEKREAVWSEAQVVAAQEHRPVTSFDITDAAMGSYARHTLGRLPSMAKDRAEIARLVGGLLRAAKTADTARSGLIQRLGGDIDRSALVSKLETAIATCERLKDAIRQTAGGGEDSV